MFSRGLECFLGVGVVSRGLECFLGGWSVF